MVDKQQVEVEKFPIIDPTKNVLDLVAALEKSRDLLRAADLKYQDAMREAETRRINELAAQKLTFDFEMSRVLRASQDAAATLLATSLKEVKNDMSDRMSKQEQFRWESGGKSQGIGAIWAAIIAAAGLLIALGTFVTVILRSAPGAHPS